MLRTGLRLTMPLLVVGAMLLSACARAPKIAPPAVPQAPALPGAPQVPQTAAPAPQPRVLDMSVAAAAGDVNADARSRPTPVVMRIYQLRSAVAFEATDFFTLFDRDQAALGGELLAKEEFQLRPGESLRLRRDIAPTARAIGVIVAYRDLERSTWRALQALPEPDTSLLRIPGKPAEVPIRIRLGARVVTMDKP